MTIKKNKLMQEWIDINKEHPIFYVHKRVIVYMPNANDKIDIQNVYNNGKGGSCFQKGWNKGEGKLEVTKWMPIPELPNLIIKIT